MMKLTISSKDLANLKKFEVSVPKNVGIALKKDTILFAKMIQKSAKLRAPRWTGKLAESINVKSNKKGAMVEVGQPYGAAQEFGFKPHYVQLYRPTGSGGVVADWVASKGVMPAKNSIFVKKNKPFILPAVQKVSSQIPDLLSKSIGEAIKKS